MSPKEWTPALGSRVAEFQLVAELGEGLASPDMTGSAVAARRWLALEHRSLSDVCLYELSANAEDSETLKNALAAAAGLDHPHILALKNLPVDGESRWCSTPFTGSHDGLLTLDGLLEQKGGTCSSFEAERAVTQLLEASACAHARGIAHGPMLGSDVLVDRRGSLFVELYGVRRAMGSNPRPVSSAIAEEVRAIAAIGYRMITGLTPEEPLVPAGRLVRKLSPAWQMWLDRGLDPAGGFVTAAEALAALPSNLDESSAGDRIPVTGPLLRRVRRVLPGAGSRSGSGWNRGR